MSESIPATLRSVLGELGAWERLVPLMTSESVVPGAAVRVVGDPVHDVLVVELGVLEVAGVGEPPRWATAGAMIGLAPALSGAPSQVAVTALRHGRLTRIPARALWELGGDVRTSMAAIARLAQLPDHGLLTLPPDPLVITALLESCDAELEASIARQLQRAIAGMQGGRFVQLDGIGPDASAATADELAACESGAATTVVYLVRGADGARAASVVAHADRVIVFQPFGDDSVGSSAHTIACDGSARRHTDWSTCAVALSRRARRRHACRRVPT